MSFFWPLLHLILLVGTSEYSNSKKNRRETKEKSRDEMTKYTRQQHKKCRVNVQNVHNFPLHENKERKKK